VWVDYDNPDHREMPDAKKYCVHLLESEEAYTDRDLTGFIGETERDEETKAMVEKALNLNGLLQPR